MKNLKNLIIPSLVFLLAISFANAQDLGVNVEVETNATATTNVKENHPFRNFFRNFFSDKSINNNASSGMKAEMRERIEKRQDNRQDRREDRQEDRQDMIEEVWGDIGNEYLPVYIGRTDNAEINAQIKTLRDSYQVKLEALKRQYLVDLKAIVGTDTLKVHPYLSATATAKVEAWQDKHNASDTSEHGNGLHLGFWAKIKSWFKGKDN